MKIGLVTPYFYPLLGGVQEHVANLYLGLKERGHEVKIITSSFLYGGRDGVKFDERDVIRVNHSVPVPINGGIGHVALPWRLKKRLKEIFEAEGFDLLHIHEPLAPTLPLTSLRLGRCKIIGTFHASGDRSLGYSLAHPFLRRDFERLDGRIAVSKAAMSFVSRYFGGEFELIPNGVMIERFSRARPIKEYDTEGWVNILFVGRLDRRKGFCYLRSAFRFIKKEFESTRLIVVGPAKKGERDGIHFVGAQHRFLPDYYRSAHIFCSPAIGRESFGIVLLEAMASGLPIVASDIPGYNEVITHGREGILVPPRDVFSLAEAIMRLIKEGDLRRRMGLSGRERAENFSWPKVIDSITRYYSKVCGYAE
jgi:phosphatidylinositol alpha-mannosyltransferase